jgi:putative PIN family toxin of toxin-antitoxin system
LDSNVYISAFTHSQGMPFHIWRHALNRSYTLLISPAIVSEVAGVLRRRFGWDDARIINRMKLLTGLAEIVLPPITVTAAVFTGPQEADNRILECAIAGRADLIVSGDRDLQRLKAYENIPIIRPVDASRALGGRSK